MPMNRYIKKVEWCAARHLYLAVPLKDNLQVYCIDYMPYEELPIVGLASLEVSDNVEKGVRIWKSELSMTLPSRPSVPDVPMSFRLTAVDGTIYLMGLSDRPHPVVTVKDNHPAATSGKCACAMTAVLNGPLPALMQCS